MPVLPPEGQRSDFALQLLNGPQSRMFGATQCAGAEGTDFEKARRHPAGIPAMATFVMAVRNRGCKHCRARPPRNVFKLAQRRSLLSEVWAWTCVKQRYWPLRRAQQA